VPQTTAQRAAWGRVATLEQAKAHRSLALLLLTIVYVFNFIDRQILVILQESIKADLGVSDAQLGLLTGFSFALFYTFVGIPIARIADKGDRRAVVAVALAVWSGMTALSGLAANYVQLLAARIGVAVGESGGSPPAHSIISDLYPAEQRGRALSIYSAGIYIGVLVGFLVGGFIDERFDWRTAFFVVGLPGVAFAAIVALALKEPLRGLSDGAPPPPAPSFLAVLGRLWALRAFRYYAVACGGTAFVLYGIGNFQPSLLARVHGLSSGDIGALLSFVQGVGGALGTFAGGFLCDHLARRGPERMLLVPIFGALAGGPLLYGGILAPTPALSVACFFLSTACFAMFLGPCLALTHGLVAQNMRAMSSAVLFLALNLIGLGLGPLTVGAFSDLFTAQGVGPEAIRWAMAATAAIGLPTTVLYWLGMRALPKAGAPET
jgi:predicted MFS family arabinose efflux permease